MSLRDWFSFATAGPLSAALLLVAALAGLIGVRLGLHRTRVARRLDSALTLLMLGVVAGFVSAMVPGADGMMALWAHAVCIAAVAIAVVRMALVLFVDFYLRERQGRAVSAIFRDVGSVVVYFLIIFAVLRFTLDVNLASLVATSAVLTAIIGLAFQDVLSSVISGLVLELEEPFDPNDWVRVGAFEGQVLETGWRTTKIRTRVNEVITLPNTYLAREPVVNYSRPDPRYGDTLRFEAAYEAPPAAVKQTVLGVLGANPSVLNAPAPEVRTGQYKESGIEYHVRYWITDFNNLERIRDQILTNVWYAMRRANLRIPFPARDVFVYPSAPISPLERGDVGAALACVPLLQPLGPDAVQTLAGQVRRLLFAPGEAIVREGEPGDSFYIIESGTVAVVLGMAHGGRTIDRMGRGAYFGEMSLLAGDRRSATVVAQEDVAVLEVGRPAFEKIVAANPAVLEPISQLAAHRLDAQREHRREDETIPIAQDPAAQRLLQRIRTFFGL